MAGKITDYPILTTLTDGDLFDVSDFDEVSAYASKSLSWLNFKTNIESQITFENLYTADGTLSGNRIVSMGVNDLTFGSTGDANLFKLETTNDRIGIGTATPTVKLDVVGTGDVFKVTSGNGQALKIGDAITDLQASVFNLTAVAGGTPTVNISDGAGGGSQPTLNFSTSGFGATLSIKGKNRTEYISSGSGQAAFSAAIGHVFSNGVSTVPAAMVHAKGINTLSSSNAILAEDSAGTDLFVVENAGNVGIGTATPTQKLQVVGNTYTTGQGSFGTAINPNSQFVVLGSGKITCIDGTHNNITTNNGSAVIGRANSTSAVEIYGGDFLASGNGASTQNTSVRGTSATTGASNNYGAKFTANLGSSQNVGMSATVGTGSTGSTIRAVQGISLYTGASTSYGGYFSSQGTGTTNVGLLARAVGATTNIAQRWDFSTLDLDYFDAGTAGATESGWVEVEIGGTQMYLRAYATI